METNFTYDRQVSGKEFIGRKAEKDLLKTAIYTGNNVSLYETPKTGKSSLLKQTLLEASFEGRNYTVIETSLLSVRTLEDFLRKFINATTDTFAQCSLRPDVTPHTSLKNEEILSLMNFPLEVADKTGKQIVLVFSEFQNVLNIPDFTHLLKLLEKASDNGQCSWIWTGSQVNRMKFIFEKYNFFHKNTKRIKIGDITIKEAETFINKGFLKSGKVIEKELTEYVYAIFKGNIYYLSHFASICDGLSRGFITKAVVEESILSLLSIHEPHFRSAVYDLTEFQTSLLKAILDGEDKFSSAETIARYKLNSSANVKRLKEALCRKEIVTFEKDGRAHLLDPLFEYWLRKFYF